MTYSEIYQLKQRIPQSELDELFKYPTPEGYQVEGIRNEIDSRYSHRSKIDQLDFNEYQLVKLFIFCYEKCPEHFI